MFYRLLVTVILLSNFSNAQLSVVNDGDDNTANYYIFVNNEVLTVDQEINLIEQDSRIYLRDEAQLVQINENNSNSGSGELSLYQQGHANQFQHNFWCSPVGNTTNNNINNDFSISLLNDIIDTTQSTPASIDNSNYNSTTGDLSGGGSPMSIASYWVFTYPNGDGGVGGWMHTQADDISPGHGFSMKGTNHPMGQQPYDFRGKPNNGTIDIPVTDGNFSLIGNPYPSALDAYEFIWDDDNKDEFDGVLRFYEDNSNSHYYVDYESGYATFTTSETDANDITALPAVYRTYNDDGSIDDSNIGNSSVIPKRYISVGQGFFVNTIYTPGGTTDDLLKIKNEHRVYKTEADGESVFAKTQNDKTKSKQVTSSGFSKISESYKRFRLNIDFNETYTRQLVSNFHSSATDGFDRGLEIKVDESFFSSSDAYLGNNYYIAEALPFDEALKMPLNIQVASDMPVRIRIADIQNFDENQSIFIHDLETNIFINLRQQDFNINLDVGDYNDRFEITFANNSISLDTEKATFHGFKVLQNNIVSSLIILNPKALNITTVSLFDISGKLVLNNNVSSTKNKVSVSTKGLSNGVYVTKINTDDNQVFTKKVVISNAR